MKKSRVKGGVLILLLLFFGAYIVNAFIKAPISEYSSLSFSMVVDERHREVRDPDRDELLLRGDVFRRQFVATEDNLGIVLIGFETYGRINSDSLIFRMRELDKDKWLYENRYNSNQFQRNRYFTFGFPVLADSKGKTYIFELESVAGKNENAVSISPLKTFATAYQLSPHDLIEKPDKALFFLTRKIGYALRNTTFPLFLVGMLGLVGLLFILDGLRLRYLGNFEIKFTEKIKKFFLKTNRVISRLRGGLNYVASTYALFEKIVSKYAFVITFVIIPIVIFLFAFVCRYTYYLDVSKPNNYFFYTLGAGSDNDTLISHALDKNAGTLSDRLSVAHDYIFTIPSLAFLFDNNGFVDSIYWLTIFLIVISSLAPLIPYFTFNFIRPYSFGGLVAAVLILSNSFLSYTSVALIIDTITTFIYSWVIAFLLLALYYRKFIFILMFGACILINTFHRPPFGMNDLAFCGLFIFIYLLPSLKNRKIVKRDIFYAVTPIVLFILVYGSWEVYHYWRFGLPYAIGNAIFSVFHIQPKVVDGLALMYRDEARHFLRDLTERSNSLGETLDNAITFLFTSLLTLFKRAQIPLVILFTSCFLILGNNRRWSEKFRTFITVFLITMGLFYMVYRLVIEGSSYTTHASNWSLSDLISITLFLIISIYGSYKSFLIRSIVLLSAVLFLLVGLGYTTIASWRHHIPLTIWLITVVAVAMEYGIQVNIKDLNTRKNIFFILAFLLTLIFIPTSLQKINSLDQAYRVSRTEINYYEKVGQILPEGAVVLGDWENMIWMYRIIGKPIVYNGQWPKYLINADQRLSYIRSEDLKNFKEAYVLDTSADYWKSYVLPNLNASSTSNYTLVEFKDFSNIKRKIYRLEVN